MKYIFAALLSLGLSAQAMASDFTKIDENAVAATYSFRDWGNFKVSKAGISNRNEAASFCASGSGYAVPGFFFPYLVAFLGMPIPELQRNIVKAEVLESEGFAHLYSGVIFFVKGETAEEEARLSQKPDMVWGLTSGNGEGTTLDSLAAINGRLAGLNQPTTSLSAICVSEKLDAAIKKFIERP